MRVIQNFIGQYALLFSVNLINTIFEVLNLQKSAYWDPLRQRIGDALKRRKNEIKITILIKQ